MAKHIYNLKRDPKDDRDRLLLYLPSVTLPAKVDLRPVCPSVYNQGSLGSCTANAIGADLDFVHKQNKPSSDFFYPSRLFIYYNERKMEGTINEDNGAYIRDGIKSVKKEGACPEKTWPYDISKFTKKPSSQAYKEALSFQAISYERILAANATLIKRALANNLPVVCGILVYDSFETDVVTRTGMIPMPNKKKESLLGGHAVLLVGYDDSISRFILRNSWGESWGDKGYGYIPYDFIGNSSLTSDIWVIKQAE